MSENASEQLAFDSLPVIKGYPELRWTGKHPYRSTIYYPAQLKESYGEPRDGWMNRLYWGDNLQVMSHLLREFRGKVDLVYIDPPFASNADYKRVIKLKGKKVEGDSLAFEDKQYTDIWSSDEYLQFMYERLILIRELLSDTGAVYLHCDWHRAAHLKCLMDEVFGPSCFQNEIVWRYSGWNKRNKTYFNKRHDTLLYYSKTASPFFDPYRIAWESEEDYARHRKQRILIEEETGRKYLRDNAGDGKRVKRYVDEAMKEGRNIDDVWILDKINNSDKEGLGYPTQKPERLLERVITSSCPVGGIVFDCFMGSGTTQAVAMKLGRRFLGADINLGSIQTTTKRLLSIARNLELSLDGQSCYTGIELYNVNNYDFFRNPVEARELLIEALDIQPFAAGHTYDGELDGRMVKILPTNRIASKADLEDFVASLPYAQFDTRKDENPSEPVERITLVCMGHEPDLKAALEQQLDEYIVDIRVMDVLRDRSDLQLKREAEADVAITDGKLIIRGFWPMNLLQKLSMERESVEDWREMVESVLIDWNYDGAVMEPSVIDIPEDKNGLVSGVYDVPEGAGTLGHVVNA